MGFNMNDILFSIVLFVISLFLIFVSKIIMYKLLKCKNFRKNLYFSTGILTFVSFIIFVLLSYIISGGNSFKLSDNLSSFSVVYLVSLFISVIINFVYEDIIYKNNKYVYAKTKNKKTKKKS